MKRIIIIILSVLLLFSCTTTAEKKAAVIKDVAETTAKTEDTAEEKTVVPVPVEEPEEDEKTEPVRTPEKEEEPSEKKEEKTEEEEKKEQVTVEKEEEPSEKKEEKTEEEEKKEQVTREKEEESVIPPSAEAVPQDAAEEALLSYTPIVYSDTGSVIAAFNYAFGVKNMNELAQSGIPFVTSYFMRGLYDAFLDMDKPVWASLGTLQNVISEFYEKYTAGVITAENGPRPETVESLLSLADPDDEMELFSYVYGFSVIRDLIGGGVDIEIMAYMAGMLDALYLPSPPLSDYDIESALNAYILYLNEEYYREEAEKAQANKEKAEAFLEKNREENDVTVLDNGVQILLLGADETLGGRPTQYDTVILDYNEYILDYETGELEYTDADCGAEISVISLPQGFQSAVTSMHVGEAVRAFIPPEVSGMAEGDGDTVEPNSLFVYDIALQKIL